ncbi:hypothetical protein ACFE04_016613 [Oxalis oulophora]
MAATPKPEPTWPQLLGKGNWSNLLDPLDLSLRKLILLSGDFIQVTYDTFNNDPDSKYCGTSRYGRSILFDRTMFKEGQAHYDVHSFLYGTARVSVPEAMLLHSHSREAWDRESNWIGYVAVTNDETAAATGRRNIYVAWRGTTRDYEWIDVLGAKQVSVLPLLTESNIDEDGQIDDDTLTKSNSSDDDDDDEDGTPKVMLGWYTIYTSNDPKSPFTKTSVRTQLLNSIKEITRKYEGENLSIILTGHSLGASLSILSAFDLVENGFNNIPVAAIVFGCPQVGNKAFKEKFNSHINLKALHVRNKIDLIPHYPSRLLGYRFIGAELEIDTRKSPYLKDSKNPSDWHNLQAMLHIVAGWNGEDEPFKFRVKRSVALVNKSCEFLKDECLVPGVWWIVKNKGLILTEDGDWIFAPPEDEEFPGLENLIVSK